MHTTAYLSDNFVRVKNLSNETTGVIVNNATVTCTVVDRLGAEVAGQVWPLALTYQAASNGVYIGEIQDSAALIVGATYIARITALGAGLQKYWELPFKHERDIGH